MEELLIDLNDSAKRSPVGDLIGSESSKKELESLLDLCDFLGGASNRNSNSTPDPVEKSLLNQNPTELLSPVGSTTIGNSHCIKLDVSVTSNKAGLMALSDCSKVCDAQISNSAHLIDSNPSNLMSPFGCSTNVITKSLESEMQLQNKVPTGDLLQVLEEPKLPDDMFDIAVLEKKQTEVVAESENLQPEKTTKLLLPSIPSIGSGESMFSSDGTINKGFMELSSNIECNDLFPNPDDSVFGEALFLSEEIAKLALCAPTSPLEGIENEDINIVYGCPDLDDIEIEPYCSEIKTSFDIFAKETEDESSKKGVNESYQKFNSSLTGEITVTSQENGSQNSGSTSSSSSISPLPLSTHRLDRMRLKATEAIGVPLNLATLKANASTRSSALPARNGPMKALIPLGQLVKSKLSSPTLSIVNKSKGTPQLKITKSSPDATNEEKSCIQMMSSTPKIDKPRISSGPDSGLNKGLIRSNHKILGRSKIHPEATSTPSRPRSSSFGRVQQIGKVSTNTKAPSVSGIKKIPGPSPKMRYSSGSPAVKTQTPSVVRSSSTGQLPVGPSSKKMNGLPQFQAFQSPLKRSNSLSTKLSQRSPTHSLVTNGMNSPAKQCTPLNKLMSKFRRNSVSRGMKENVSPI